MTLKTHMSLSFIWIIIFLAGLPQLSETVYSPFLPKMASLFQVSESLIEHTMTIFIFGFALGVLFWGKASDHWGRKPCVIMGLMIFILGSLGCAWSQDVYTLMMCRFFQAFGGGIGSVLTQVMCRDLLHGPDLGRAYTSIGISLTLFPTIGPIFGQLLEKYFSLPSIFIFLALVALGLLLWALFFLPETLKKNQGEQNHLSMVSVALKLLKDTEVASHALIIGGCSGIIFGYASEAPFYFIKILGCSPWFYSYIFFGISFFSLLGGLLSRYLQRFYSLDLILKKGLWIIFFSALGFSLLIFWHYVVFPLEVPILIAGGVAFRLFSASGISMVTANSLALSLRNYKSIIGTASSIFGFFYYFLIGCFVFLMGVLHNGTLMPMAFYFLSISILMIVFYNFFIQKN